MTPTTRLSQTNAMPITGFEFQTRTRYVFGVGCVERVGELAREAGGTRALIVTDAGLVAAGHCDLVRKHLVRAGLETVIFEGVHENPTTREVADCVEAAREGGIDLIVGLGGGSSIDTAKGCALILANGGDIRDFWHTGKRSVKTLPLVAVPTTAGTGSESQSYALIADEKTHRKMAVGDPMLAVDAAVLDPRLTLTQPAVVTACCGLDAVSHAIETAVTTRATPISRLFSREAFALVSAALPRVFEDPSDLEARANMQLGASLAGLAIECSMLGAAHAAANPLTAVYGLVHGHAVSAMLPHVIRHNARDSSAARGYQTLLQAVNLNGALAADDGPGESLAAWVESLLDGVGMPRSLAALGVQRAAIAALAKDAVTQWTGRFNPVALDERGFAALYEQAL